MSKKYDRVLERSFDWWGVLIRRSHHETVLDNHNPLLSFIHTPILDSEPVQHAAQASTFSAPLEVLRQGLLTIKR